MTLFRALRLGFHRALDRLWPVLALWGTGACEVLASSALGLLALHALGSGNWRGGGAGMVALAAAWLAARAARAVVAYGALTASAAALQRQPEPAAGPALLGTAGRALGYFALSSALEIFLRVWVWTSLVATGWSFLATAGQGGAAATPSLGLAFTLSAAAPLSLALALWSDASLARSAGRGEPFSVALLETARALWRRPWAPLAIVVVTGLLRWTAEVSVTSVAGLASPAALSGGPPPAALGAQLTGGLLVALAAAIFELARLVGLQALDLDVDRGPAEPILALPVQAEPILEATPVDAPGSGG